MSIQRWYPCPDASMQTGRYGDWVAYDDHDWEYEGRISAAGMRHDLPPRRWPGDPLRHPVEAIDALRGDPHAD